MRASPPGLGRQPAKRPWRAGRAPVAPAGGHRGASGGASARARQHDSMTNFAALTPMPAPGWLSHRPLARAVVAAADREAQATVGATTPEGRARATLSAGAHFPGFGREATRARESARSRRKPGSLSLSGWARRAALRT